jgi:hypothetical protein
LGAGLSATPLCNKTMIVMTRRTRVMLRMLFICLFAVVSVEKKVDKKSIYYKTSAADGAA